jgi:DNA primase
MSSILESLVEQDFGLKIDSENYARAIRHNSLVIDRKNQVFHWNSEDIHGTAYTYLLKVRRVSKQQAKDYLKTFAEWKDTFIVEIQNKVETVVYPKLVDVFASNLWTNDKDHFYWKQRNISDETLRRFQVGRFEDFYSIPLFEDGILKQFHLRRDNPKIITHYYKNVGPILFNQDVIRFKSKKEPLFIVEGVTDVLAFQQLEIPCVCSSNGCDAFLKEWIKYFVNERDIIICYDNDSAGDFGSKRVAKILGEYRCRIYNFWDCVSKGYDANDWLKDNKTKEELMETINTYSMYSFEMGN